MVALIQFDYTVVALHDQSRFQALLIPAVWTAEVLR